MTLDSSKFIEINGYAIPLRMVAERTASGVRLHDGRLFERD
jgi:hypothetical protein